VVYALIIAITAGLALLAIPAVLYLAGQRAKDGSLSLSGWSFRPNVLGFTVIALIASLALSRIFPGFLLLTMLIPFVWRFRGGGRGGGGGDGGQRPRPGGPFVWQWRVRRDPPSTSNGHSNGHDKPDERRRIEGQPRHLDDE